MAPLLFQLAAIIIVFVCSPTQVNTLEYTANLVHHYNELAGVYSGGNSRPGARYCPGSFVINGDFWLYGGFGSVTDDSM